MSSSCSSDVVQSIPNEIITEAGNEEQQCVTIVTDTINCSSPQVLNDRNEETDADDTGIMHLNQAIVYIHHLLFCLKKNVIVLFISLVDKARSEMYNSWLSTKRILSNTFVLCFFHYKAYCTFRTAAHQRKVSKLKCLCCPGQGKQPSKYQVFDNLVLKFFYLLSYL